MSLQDYFDNVPAPTPFPQCRTCRWYSELPLADQEFFDLQVVNDPVRLRKACNAAGLDIRRSAFQEHLATHHDVLRAYLKANGGEHLTHAPETWSP